MRPRLAAGLSGFLACLLALEQAHAQIPIPIAVGPVRPEDVAVNPITHEIWVTSPSDDRVVVVDGATHAFQSIPVGDQPRRIHIDPVRNHVWVSHSSAVVTLIDGASRTAFEIALPSATALAIDPYLGRAYAPLTAGLGIIDSATRTLTTVAAPLGNVVVEAARNGVIVRSWDSGSQSHTLHRMAGDPLAVTDTLTLDGWFYPPIAAFAVDARTERVIVGNFNGAPVVGDWDTASTYVVPDFMGFASFGAVPEPTAGRVWVASDDPFTQSASFLFVFDPATLAQSPPNVFVPPFDRVAVNPATRRAYTANEVDFGLPSTPITIIDGATLSTAALSIPGYSAARRAAVDVASNRVYVAATRQFTLIHDLIEVDEPVAGPVPLDVAISIDPIVPGLDPVARFTATSGFAPHPLPIRQIYYQVDATNGEWSYADASGAAGSATLTGLAPGAHTVHAFATDGQEVTVHDFSGTPVVGPIASHSFVVPPPPACGNGIDDDGDGATDHPADAGCASPLADREDPACDNQIDDDGDELVDHPSDPSCFAAWDGNESAGGNACGIGAELALLLAALRRRIARRT